MLITFTYPAPAALSRAGRGARARASLPAARELAGGGVSRRRSQSPGRADRQAPPPRAVPPAIGRARRPASPRPNSAAIPCDIAQICSATMRTGTFRRRHGGDKLLGRRPKYRKRAVARLAQFGVGLKRYAGFEHGRASRPARCGSRYALPSRSKAPNGSGRPSFQARASTAANARNHAAPRWPEARRGRGNAGRPD